MIGILISNALFVDELISEKCLYAFVEKEHNGNVLRSLKYWEITCLLN